MRILCSRFLRLPEIGHVRFSYDIDIVQNKSNELLKEWDNEEITLSEFSNKYNSLLEQQIKHIRTWNELLSHCDTVTIFSE